jgi:hypothetical protein
MPSAGSCSALPVTKANGIWKSSRNEAVLKPHVDQRPVQRSILTGEQRPGLGVDDGRDLMAGGLDRRLDIHGDEGFVFNDQDFHPIFPCAD